MWVPVPLVAPVNYAYVVKLVSIHSTYPHQDETTFLSRVSILLLTRDIDIVILSVRPSVCLSVRGTPVLYENGLTYRHSFSTVR